MPTRSLVFCLIALTLLLVADVVTAVPGVALDRVVHQVVGEPALCDFNGDGFEDLAIRLPGYDHDAAADAGAVDVVYGSEVGLSAAHGRRIVQSDTGHGSSEAGDRFGFATSCADVNGDGFVDLVVGSPGENAHRGRVDVILGSARGLRPRRSIALANPAAEPGAQFGWAVAATPPGGGVPRIVVGAPGSANDRGAVFYIAPQAPTSWSRIDNPTGALSFGASVASGDLDGDMIPDLAIGAPGGGIGAVVAVLGPTVDGAVAATAVYDPEAWPGGRRYGEVVHVFDLNRDGSADVVVGDPRFDGADGMLEVLGLSRTGALVARAQSDAAAFDMNPTDSAHLGSAIAIGDFDDDGVTDIAIGLPTRDRRGMRDAGQIGIYYAAGDSPGATTPRLLDPGSPGIQDRPDAFDLFGSALTAGDYDGDGYKDLAVYAPGDPSAKTYAGLVHVLRGSSSGITHTGDATIATSAVGRAQRKAFFAWTVDPSMGGTPAGPAISVEHFTIGPSGDPRAIDAPYAQLVGLIAAADPNSEILVALYRMRNDNGLVADLLTGLEEAATQRAVDVRFVVDSSFEPETVDHLVGRGFAVTVCETNCVGGDNGAQHSKFVLFSSVGGVPAVVSSSANWTLAGLASSFESMAVIREFDPTTSLIFDGHRERFLDFEGGRIDEGEAATVVYNGAMTAAFFPWLQGDPVVDALDEVELTVEAGGADTCAGESGRSVVRLAAARADGRRTELAARLAELRNAGCKVQVFANEGALPLVRQLAESGFTVFDTPRPRRSGVWCVSGQHSKQLAIVDRSAAKAERIAWLGSHNLEVGNLRNSADTWLRFDRAASYRAVSRHMDSMFGDIEPCRGVAGDG